MRVTNKLNITYNAIVPSGKTFTEKAESNAVSTEILSYAVKKTIRSDKTSVQEGEKVCNTVTVTNNSATKLFNNLFTISPLKGATFVAGSVKVNGIVQPTFDPVKRFTIPDLNPNETAIIEYELKVNNPTTVTPITHFATLNYTVNDPARGNVQYRENTETVTVNVISNKFSVIKTVDYYGSDAYFKTLCACSCNCDTCYRCDNYCGCLDNYYLFNCCNCFYR